jgi:hypothetical protein
MDIERTFIMEIPRRIIEMKENIDIEYQGTTVKPSYGGKRIEIEYIMKHTKYGKFNEYCVTCELLGLQIAEPYLSICGVEFIGDIENLNDETLTREAASDLFELKANL